MSILAFDPASYVTGYAVLDWRRDAEDAPRFDGSPLLVSAGRISVTGSKRGMAAHVTQIERSWQLLHAVKPNANRRVAELEAYVMQVIDIFAPTAIVVEIPSGKAGAGSKKGAKSSLAVYGYAAGCVRGWASRAGVPVLPIDERTWTQAAGVKKEMRPLTVQGLYPHQYDPDDDDGADMADAILLGRWALQQLVRHNLAQELFACPDSATSQ